MKASLLSEVYIDVSKWTLWKSRRPLRSRENFLLTCFSWRNFAWALVKYRPREGCSSQSLWLQTHNRHFVDYQATILFGLPNQGNQVASHEPCMTFLDTEYQEFSSYWHSFISYFKDWIIEQSTRSMQRINYCWMLSVWQVIKRSWLHQECPYFH